MTIVLYETPVDPKNAKEIMAMPEWKLLRALEDREEAIYEEIRRTEMITDEQRTELDSLMNNINIALKAYDKACEIRRKNKKSA